jgi:hypothetical protein
MPSKAKPKTKCKPKGTPRKSVFLRSFSVCGRVDHAARAAKIDRSLHYQWLEKDADYPALFAKAKAQAIQALEDEAVLRSTEGVFEPCTFKGHFVYHFKEVQVPVIDEKTGKPRVDPKTKKPMFETREVEDLTRPYGMFKKSDRLLEFMLKAWKPEVYRDRVEHSGKVTEEWKFSGSIEELMGVWKRFDDQEKQAAGE